MCSGITGRLIYVGISKQVKIYYHNVDYVPTIPLRVDFIFNQNIMKTLSLNYGWSEWKKKNINRDSKVANYLIGLTLCAALIILFDYALTKVYVITILNSY